MADYKEVYIDVSFDTLVKRDNKELYKKALNGEIKDVVGVDIEFKAPYSPDMIIDNNLDNPNYEVMIQKIIYKFNLQMDSNYSYTSKDLLRYPHKYQYSKYEGKKFFSDYKEDRSTSLLFLNKRLSKYTNNLAHYAHLKSNLYVKNENIILK